MHVGLDAREDSAPVSQFVDFGEVSETCAPVSNEAKRPSRSAKYRLNLHRGELGLLQGRSVSIVNRAYRAILAREALNDGLRFVVGYRVEGDLSAATGCFIRQS